MQFSELRLPDSSHKSNKAMEPRDALNGQGPFPVTILNSARDEHDWSFEKLPAVDAKEFKYNWLADLQTNPR
jgi:hypothetical protein